MKDISTKNGKDLTKSLIEKRESLRNFRFGVSGSKIRNMKEGRGLRKEIAQILTELSRRNNELKTKQ